MKKLILAALILLPVISHSQDVDQYTEAFNSHPRYDQLKKAAAGDKDVALVEVGYFINNYCENSRKCHWMPKADLEIKGEVGVKLAKIYLKTIEQANRRYAEALVEFNKKINECQEQPSTLFSHDSKENCSEEIICKGKKAEELRDFFSEYNNFEKQIGVTQRELSDEEKAVFGEDISFLTKKPNPAGTKYDYSIDTVYPKFSMAPMLQVIDSRKAEKKMFTTKIESRVFQAVRFDDNYLPDGIMTLRGLSCEDEKITKGETVKKDEFGCSLLVGNKSAKAEELMGMKRCLVKESFFTSFKNMFSKKKEAVEVNESDRSKIKEKVIQDSEFQPKASQSSER